MSLGAAVLLPLVLAAARPTPSAAPGPTPVVLDRILAVVGDEILLESDVERFVAVEVVPRAPNEDLAVYRERVLNDRIVDLLRERELRKTAGFAPDPREVEKRIAALAERLKTERGETLEAVLARAAVSRSELFEWVRRGMALSEFVRERLLPRVKVTDEEVRAYWDGPLRQELRAKGHPQPPPLTEVEESIRDLLRERKLNDEIARWTAELKESTRILVYRR